MNLGLTSTDRVLSAVPFPIEQYYHQWKEGKRPHPFCEGYITKVEKQTRVADKYVLLDGVELEPDTKPTPEQVVPESRRHLLVFTFTDKTNTFSHTEEFWDDTEKPERVTWKVNRACPQIMAAYMGLDGVAKLLVTDKPGEGLLAIDPEATKSFSKWYRALAKAFNEGKNGKPVFETEEGKPIPVRFKITRQTVGKGTNNLQLSMNGNCIERISNNPDVKSILSVIATGKNPDKFDIIETTSNRPATSPLAQQTPNAGGGANTGWPDDL